MISLGCWIDGWIMALKTIQSRVAMIGGRSLQQVSSVSWRAGKTTAERGYGGKWQRERASFLRENPLCVDCLEAGVVAAATVVDHKVPHRGDQKLFWDRDNWQPLCDSHHSSDAQRRDNKIG